MKSFLIICAVLVLPLSGVSQQVQVLVANPAPLDRPLETVEVSWKELEPFWGKTAKASAGVFISGAEIPSQTIDTDGDGEPDLLLFQSPFRAEESRRFLVRPTERQTAFPAMTDAKYILPRKDVAWENDHIAYRIYGGPLAGDVLNGVDVWVKRVRSPIIDKWYAGDSLKGKQRISYHVDHGEGADLFLVGRSLGAGGSARWTDGTLDQAGLFSAYRIISTGPIRATFSVDYTRDSLHGGGFMEEKIYSLDAGMNLNKIEVAYPAGVGRSSSTAVGLVKRAMTEAASDVKEGWLALWGPTDADSVNGFLGTGVVIPPASTCRFLQDSLHYYLVVPPMNEDRLTYFAGACWTRSGDCANVTDWKHYLSHWSRSLRYPLQITLTALKQ